MGIDKSYGEFMVLYEKDSMTKDIKILEKQIKKIIDKSSTVVEDLDDINKVSKILHEGMREFKKILIKEGIYEVV